MNIQTTTVDKICIIPVVGTVIGIGTIASNVLKSIADIARINFLRLATTYYSIRGNTHKELKKREQLQQAQADLVQHIKFIAIGTLRLVPVVGGFILYSHDIHAQRQENQLRNEARSRQQNLQQQSSHRQSHSTFQEEGSSNQLEIHYLSGDIEIPNLTEKAQEVAKSKPRRQLKNITTLGKKDIQAINKKEGIEKAASGDIRALIDLGDMYYTGNGVDKSYAEALKYYEQAAQKGDKDAQNHVAYMFRRRQGIGSIGHTEADKRALHWTKEAANQNLNVAQYNLGNFFKKGIGTNVDLDQAIAWYNKAANNGFPEACYPLGELLEGKNQISGAIEAYKKAAELDNTDAMQNLAKLYYNIYKSTTPGDVEAGNEAFKWIEKVALKNVSEAQHTLANFFIKGVGTPVSEKTAFELYSKAANNGLLISKRQLVIMLRKGQGTPKDTTQIFKWLKSIAEDKDRNQEDIENLFRFGLKLEQGEGYPQNRELAIECYKAAVALGHVSAEIILGKVYLEIILGKIKLNGSFGITISPQISLEIFQRNINKDPLAKYYLAKMYANNMVPNVGNSIAEAVRLYSEAATTTGFPEKNITLSLKAAKELISKHTENPLAKYYLAQAYAKIGTNTVNVELLTDAERLYLEAAQTQGLSDEQIIACYKEAKEFVGSRQAALALFELYLKEEKGLIGNQEAAFKLLENLENCEDGKYHQQIFDLIYEAVEKGTCIPAGYYQLGMWYITGLQNVLDEVSINNINYINGGKQLLEAAAEKGYTPSIVSLITIYSTTNNADFYDLPKAVHWYKEAQKLGDSTLLQELDAIETIAAVKSATIAN